MIVQFCFITLDSVYSVREKQELFLNFDILEQTREYAPLECYEIRVYLNFLTLTNQIEL